MKRTRCVIAALVLAFVAAGCGGDDANGGSDNAAFNQVDVAFAQGMIPHHQQAVEMADLAIEKSESPKVVDLAEQIKAAQDPEITQMESWLEEWDQGVPDSGGGMGGHDMDDMGDSGGEGMMSDHQMQELESASGTEFDELFLSMMIEHHEGAVQMAEIELDQGENPEAKDLAETIIETQNREIGEMTALRPASPE